MRRRVQWRRHQHLYGGSWSNDAGVGVEYSDLCRRVLYCCVPAVAKLTKFKTRTTLTGPPSLMARAPVPAAATCASIDIPNSDKSTGTGTGVSTITGGTVAVTWSAGALHARLVRSRAAFAPVCCRRARPERPLCSRHGVGALDCLAATPGIPALATRSARPIAVPRRQRSSSLAAAVGRGATLLLLCPRCHEALAMSQKLVTLTPNTLTHLFGAPDARSCHL
jgi:hypothetical protein